MFAHKLKYEVLVELDPQNPDAMEEMEKSKDQLQKDMGKRRDLSNLTIDRELFHKILLAVREQKRKYLATAGRVEVSVCPLFLSSVSKKVLIVTNLPLWPTLL